MEAERANAVEDESGLCAEMAEGIRVGGVGSEDGDGRRWVGLRGPFEGFGQFGGATARKCYGFERGRWGVEELEGLSYYILTCEA